MSDFNQAIVWLKEGKKVRRNYWSNKNYNVFMFGKYIYSKHDKESPKEHFPFTLEDIEAEDWEIYCEEHKFFDKNINYNEYCGNCGIEKLDKLKTLKDLLTVKEHSDAEYILKQEAIKWVKRALIEVNSRDELKERFIFEEVDYNILELHAVIREKKYFFNITEEDLK